MNSLILSGLRLVTMRRAGAWATYMVVSSVGHGEFMVTLTRASAVEKAIPFRLPPVMMMVLPRTTSAKALATSMASVSWPNSG
jgi:hypothetical protein